MRTDFQSPLRRSVPPLKAKRPFSVGHALFIPRNLARGVTAENIKARIAGIPLATSVGGQFRETLERGAVKAKWSLNIAVSCSSFTQAAGAVKSGACGAELPQIAAQDFDPAKIVERPLPFLRGESRHVSVAWNPRLAEVRGIVASAVDALENLCVESKLKPAERRNRQAR